MSKRQKKHQKPLSQAEIWDDSALVNSWDSALAEYKLYHSIHLNGERVEDVIKEYRAQHEASAEEDETTEEAVTTASANEAPGLEHNAQAKADELEDGEVEEDDEIEQSEATVTSLGAAKDADMAGAARADLSAASATPSAMPFGSMGVSDDALKNLLMSWYWAGYYTGLHEGQQQAKRI